MEMIPIERNKINGETVQTVSARDLHATLGVRKDFSNWIKAQIKRARLIDGRDFCTLAQKGERGNQGLTERIEYHLTIDSGKHIAMLCGTEAGHRVREYFIEVERRHKAAQLPVMTNAQLLVAIATQAAEQEQRVAAIEDKLRTVEARIPHEQDYFTVVGYARLQGFVVSNSQALAMGRAAARLSRERGLPIGDTTDPRYGSVHTYHASVLDDVSCQN